MRKIVNFLIVMGMIFSFSVLSLSVLAVSATAASKNADKYKDCNRAGPKNDKCRSRAQRAARERKKCEAVTDESEKAACLQEIADKSAKGVPEAAAE